MKAVLIVFAVVGLVAAGVLEGMRTNRWGASEEVKTVAERLTKVPGAFGEWTSKDAVMDPNIMKVAGATGYVDRTYTNGVTGETLGVLILSGPSGPIGAHTPDIC